MGVPGEEALVREWREILQANGIPADDLSDARVIEASRSKWGPFLWGPPGPLMDAYHLVNWDPARDDHVASCDPGEWSEMTGARRLPPEGIGTKHPRCPECWAIFSKRLLADGSGSP
jgi:hypothetical protein